MSKGEGRKTAGIGVRMKGTYDGAEENDGDDADLEALSAAPVSRWTRGRNKTKQTNKMDWIGLDLIRWMQERKVLCVMTTLLGTVR